MESIEKPISVGGMQQVDDAMSPDRCQYSGSNRQCSFKVVPGTSLCPQHTAPARLENQPLRNYRLTKFQAQLQRHSSSSEIKNLRDEIGILRMIMEERLNMCNDASDLILQSGPIGDLVLKIEKVVASCHKLEGAMGQLLDKQALLQFASEMISVINDEVGDVAKIEKITNKMLEIIARGKDLET